MPPESRRDAKHYPVAYSQTTWTCLISPLSYRPQETGQHISNMGLRAKLEACHVQNAYACMPMALAHHSFDSRAVLSRVP